GLVPGTGPLVHVGGWAAADRLAAATVCYTPRETPARGATLVCPVRRGAVNRALLSGARLDAEVLRLRQLRDGLPAEEAISVTPRSTSALAGQARRRAKMLDEFAEIRRFAETGRGGAGSDGTAVGDGAGR